MVQYWIINKKTKLKLKVAEKRILRWMCDVIKLDKIGNEYIRMVWAC